MTGGLKGKLLLQDGSVYEGYSFGFSSSAAGEVVFNTGMVGYPESLTDPSYQGQILLCTYPLIGNYGLPPSSLCDNLPQYFESAKIHLKGLVVSDYSANPSHWSSTKSLGDWLKEHHVPALFGIDTRSLTKKLREEGVMLGKIIFGQTIEFENPNTRNLVAEVSTKEKKAYPKSQIKIVLIDCGVKNNIIRCFLKRNITVIQVPWNYNFLGEEYDGLLVSNGPGDPKQCLLTISNLKIALKKDKPIFGICLGSQLLALAAGADTYKLRYGHRGQNQPCLEVGTKRCYITSQNHGYAVDEKTLPADWQSWFRNANDGTNEGFRHKTKPFFAVQFHPEASPGPEDTEFLIDQFIGQLKARLENEKIEK
ncbi:MAG: glutamine-hydrolyzing carbamoyl-phosphate synthase small subunit [Nanoarchaeota archaeon]